VTVLPRLAAYKIPARWAFSGTSPLTATGKIRKDVLGAQLVEDGHDARISEGAGTSPSNWTACPWTCCWFRSATAR
jgi:hypothetical protein